MRRKENEEIVHVSHVIERRSLVLDHCVSACQMQTCQNGGKCINNFKNIKCDCIGTGYEGSICEQGKCLRYQKTSVDELESFQSINKISV